MYLPTWEWTDCSLLDPIASSRDSSTPSCLSPPIFTLTSSWSVSSLWNFSFMFSADREPVFAFSPFSHSSARFLLSQSSLSRSMETQWCFWTWILPFKWFSSLSSSWLSKQFSLKTKKDWLGNIAQVWANPECSSMLAMTLAGKKVCLPYGRTSPTGLITATSTKLKSA